MYSDAMIFALGGEQGKTNGVGLDGVSSLDGHTCFLILDADGRVDHHLLWGTRPDHHVFCRLDDITFFMSRQRRGPLAWGCREERAQVDDGDVMKGN